ncbi:MAG: hypothetical protein NTX49_01690 [Chlamydiae bacterium]|nr:hypothetical protein [Chlamydiota bacterium]
MKIALLKITLYTLLISAFGSVSAEDIRISPIEKTQNYYNVQDRPNPEIDNPTKGLTSFLFFPMCPAKDKKMADNIFALVEKKLTSYGQVNKTRILVETDQGEAIDLSVFKVGVTLIYEIKNLKDLSGNETGFVRASLNLYTAIEIVKTKEVCRPYIWSSNCFLKGSEY